MLEVFKIAFPKRHSKQDYILPARLLSMPIKEKWEETGLFLRLEYKYDFMPRGLVNQLCAELSKYISSDDQVWNNAVNLTSKTGDCQVFEDFYNRTIRIKAKGKDARGLIILIMNSLNEITESYKGVKAEISVPCICKKCSQSSRPTNFLYDKLIEWSESRDNVYCNESGENLSIEELLFTVGLAKDKKNDMVKLKNNFKPKKFFISYSKFDESYLQDFQDHLVTLKKEGLVTFDCREIDFGVEWDKKIKEEIEESEVIVCLVSVKFLNTDYITKIEIPKAIEQNKIIIPIIIKACDWENSELGKYQAAQRGKVVSLNNNGRLMNNIIGHSEEEKAAFWTGIVKELRQKLF
jgi:hypothetical protein